MSNTEDREGKIVSVTSQGQATIPKRYREKLGLDTPGRVKFREDEDGKITIEQVQSIRDFRGIASSEERLTSELRAERDRDREREDDAADQFSDGAQ